MAGEKTATAIENLDDAIRYRLSRYGGRSVTSDAFQSWPWAPQFRVWIEPLAGRLLVAMYLKRSPMLHHVSSRVSGEACFGW